MSEDPKTWDELAAQVGHTRQSLVKWRTLSGAPQNRNIQDWKVFIEANQLGKNSGQGLKDEKTRHEILLIQARLAREKRTVVPMDEVNALLLHLSTQSRTVLYQFMETEAPPKLDGMSAAQMRPILREMADTICGKMGDLIKEFEER